MTARVHVQRKRDPFSDEQPSTWEAEIRVPIRLGWCRVWTGEFPTWREAFDAGCDALRWGYWRHRQVMPASSLQLHPLTEAARRREE